MYFNTNINLIKIPRKFSASNPNEDKLAACRRFYRINHRLNRDIVVDENMELKDGYIGYLILKENHVSTVAVRQKNFSRITIVYGVHPGVEKEYCWRIIDETENKQNLRVGSHAIVRTRFGDVEVLVTKIESVTKTQRKKMGHVKRVVRCLAE